jgi:LysR family transcriptional regulator, glycine cleavage system transcriptional activator
VPPLNSLRAFEAAARLHSFKQAAAELHVTPTAISHQIRLLESLVGTRLFERLTRAVVLTEDGQRLFPALREGFARIAQAAAELRSERESITVSVTTAFASKLLIPSLSVLRVRHPHLRLRVDATEALVNLHKMEADLVVRYADDRPTSCESKVLFSDRYIAVAAPAWLSKRGATLPASELARLPLVAYRWKNTALRGPSWQEWMDLAGVQDFDITSCHLFSEEIHALQAAVDGLGVALVSDVLVRNELKDGRLVQMHPLALPGFTFKALYLADHMKIASIRQVLRWMSTLASRRSAVP